METKKGKMEGGLGQLLYLSLFVMRIGINQQLYSQYGPRSHLAGPVDVGL